MSDVVFIANGIVGKNPSLSGGETRFIEIAKNWQKAGDKINLLSPSGGKGLCEKLDLKVQLHCSSRLTSAKRFLFIGRFLESFFIPTSLNSFKKGIIYCTNEQLYDVIPGVLLKLRNPGNIRLAVVVHWLPPAAWWRIKQSSFLNSLFFLISERIGLFLGCLFADKLLPVSESTHEQIKKSVFGRFFDKKVKTVFCGVNYKRVRLISKEAITKKYEAVFMKRIQAVKGIFDLINVWEMVVKKIPQAKLVIMGSGVDEESAKKIVLDKRLTKNIEFLGTVFDEKEKFTKIAESKVFLLPSYEENWAIVIGEAMAAGIPVVCYLLKELEEVWHDFAVFVPVGNQKIMAEKIIELLRNPEKSQKISKRALEFVRQYDWEKIAKNEKSIILDQT